MAKKQPQSALQTSERDGQLSSSGGLQNYFLRNIPMWNPPAWQEAEYWRKFVEKQPLAAICRDSLASYLNSLDWSIVARDSDRRDELKGKIKHYTKLFERGNAYYYDVDFTSQVEWFCKELFTLPFGMASEIGRIDDNPKGRVVWIRPLDCGTLAPTLNFEFPIVQSAPNTGISPIYFPREFISRVFLSPRTELRREGWGYAPPERIWKAIEMMYAGDSYYAKFLLNTPEAGILDLGDMEKTSALQWIDALKDLMFGIEPLKIPVLYEHTTDAKFIPFGRDPSTIGYDSTTMRYAAILAAGYGLTLSDIGFPTSSNGGDTLAGTIRMERVGKSSGKATAKKKWETYANQILDPELRWMWIDYDDERNVSKGRARLASAQAAGMLIDKRSFLPSEMRRQFIADGLMTIDVPEEIDENDPEFQNLQQPAFGGGNKTKELNNKTQPSSGGQGEVIPQQVIQRSMASAEVGVSKASYNSSEILKALLSQVQKNLSESELELWEEYVDGYLTGKSEIEEEELKSVLDNISKEVQATLKGQVWVEGIAEAISKRIIEIQTSVETDKAAYRASQEEDFVTEKSDNILQSQEDISVGVMAHYSNLYGVVFESLTDTFAKHTVSISKSRLLSEKLEIDATERVSENIRVSREISKDVLQNFSRIIHSVYETGSEWLQDQINFERINQDAVS